VHAAHDAQQPGSITVTYLELTDPGQIRPPLTPAPRELATRVVRDPARNRDLYTRVGADYSWIDRLVWSDRQWRAWAARVETHLVELRGRTIGYFELEPEPAATKVAIFGLLGSYHGRGLGGHALIAALRRGFELRPRVWLTTCSLDSPAALPNYRARGLEVFRVEERPWSPPA
jgi:RimJ/RimL family protein N-acetyltransferase